MLATAAAVAAPMGLGMLAVGETTNWDPTSLIGTAVTPVIVVALFMFGKLHGPGEFDRLVADCDRLRAENDKLHESITERVIPAVTKSTLAVENFASLVQTEIHVRRRPGG